MSVGAICCDFTSFESHHLSLDCSYPCSSRRRKLVPSDIEGGKTIVYFTLIFVIRFLSAIVEKPMYLRKPAQGNPERAS